MNKLEYINRYKFLRDLYDEQMEEYVRITFDLNNYKNISNEEKVEILTHGFIDNPPGMNTVSVNEVSVAIDYFLSFCNTNLVLIFSQNFYPHAKDCFYYLLRGCLSLVFEKRVDILFEEFGKVFDKQKHTLFIETLVIQSKEEGEEWCQNSKDLLDYLNIDS